MQRIIKVIFIHDDDGYSQTKCKEEIKKILYSTKPYNHNDSMIDILETIPIILPLDKPHIL